MAKKKLNRSSTVIRVPKDTLELLNQYRGSHDTWGQALEVVLERLTETAWVLPSDLFPSKAKARGEAMKRAVITKAPEPEVPVTVIL